ncbi:hypothetical protein [Sphingomonas sp. RIT328]|uniref:hypothetical protein n=1 Tax=Sphingomonas sp. RIT328 TaxID=1470591 RepID=UPI00044AEBCB|nr:hypothetical protein [Sphingomonas sp. RIT328]EZP54979.1 hypothetical protein BW41_01249 [Sphingomonas sp. RIT328]
MSGTISWVHVGDLHADEADDWLGIRRLEAIVAELADVREGSISSSCPATMRTTPPPNNMTGSAPRSRR